MFNRLHIILKRIIFILLFLVLVIGGAAISTVFFHEPYSYIVAGFFGILLSVVVIKFQNLWENSNGGKRL